ncbi:hypothetical protein SPRG_17303 [Saprolegnia parasitica CBS 223.65]|uniref:PX domain-containing protein n=1 Tax=Saprolegnia parasitica (strain CBS 223.65) TaxID=695850 RepID=A0A067BSK7_SAPPC|nr:hypothetical protein SPRG_17303 [Saprolegnia parasitica CBS 223.65]KDO17261.1 hypothetical protein SPRG_17303 [Saprolegnia parasitica CBS 223.65]|eukprot:XP_012212029.1 hypothetical protein SPRG_17303 [Saprolegnia parasitica CBS 223.65]
MRQVLLSLTGHSTATSASGRNVELYHVSFKDGDKTRKIQARHKTLRQHLKPILEMECLSAPLPRKFLLKGSSHDQVVRERLRCFRRIFVDLSAKHVSESTVALLHRLMDASAVTSAKMAPKTSQNRVDPTDSSGPRTPNELLPSNQKSSRESSSSSLDRERSASFSHIDESTMLGDNNYEERSSSRLKAQPLKPHQAKMALVESDRLFFARAPTPTLNRPTLPMDDEDEEYIQNLATTMMSRLRAKSPPPRHASPLRQAQSEPWLPIEPLDRQRDAWRTAQRFLDDANDVDEAFIKDMCAEHFPHVYTESSNAAARDTSKLSEQRLMGYLPHARPTKVSPMRRNMTY